MEGPDRSPNTLLAARLAQAGWSNKGFAARVRTAAARRGVQIRCTHADVARWLDGRQPRPRTAAVIAEVLGDVLAKRLSPADVGMATEPTEAVDEQALRWSDEPMTAARRLAALARRDFDAVPELVASAPVTDAWRDPILSWWLSRPASVARTEGVGRVGAVDVDAVRSTTAFFMKADFQYGGGHARHLLAIYFANDVMPLLEGRYTDAIGRQLFAAAAEVAQLLGWTAYDTGTHGLAQRYFIQALRLAQAGDDRALGSRLLSNMSHQATYLGDFSEGVQLARAAQEGIRGFTGGTVAALFHAMEARAAAGLGDQRATAEALGRAESEFNNRDTSADPAWVSYFDDAELAGEAAHCFRDLRSPATAQGFVDRAIELTDPAYARTLAFIRLVHAACRLHAAAPHEAAQLAVEATDLAGTLRSKRYRRYVRDLRRDLARYRASEGIADAMRRLDVVLADDRALTGVRTGQT